MKILTQLANQYLARHGKLPEAIVVHPIALAALTVKQSIAPLWGGVPVICRDIKPAECTGKSSKLGITVVDGVIRSFDM